MAKRYARDKTPSLPPVEKVEVSEKHIKLRVVLFILLLVIGVVAIGFGVSFLFAKESGWYEISPENSQQLTGKGYSFYYYLEDEGFLKKSERKAVTSAYSTALDKAYITFTNLEFGESVNINTLNKKPNTEIIVDSALYSALEKLKNAGIRNHFLAPLYPTYNNIYTTESDVFLKDYDPSENSEVRAFFDKVLTYANDPNKVDVVLLGDNKVKLSVSADYIAFAQSEGITSFVDFGWMTNAFIVDYVADSMVAKNFTKGSFSSTDGFIRNFCTTTDSFFTNIYDVRGDQIYLSANFRYSKNMAIISYKGFILSPADYGRYYQTDEGKVYTPFISPIDGLTKGPHPYLMVYSTSNKCVDLLTNTVNAYVGDSLDEVAIQNLPTFLISYVYCKDAKILTNDENAVFNEVYHDETFEYKVEVVK